MPNPNYTINENIRNASLTIGTNSTLISPQVEQGQRVVLVITNTSTTGQIITLSWGSEAQNGAGVVLYVGGSWSESIDTAFTPSNAPIYAVSNSAGGTISIHERVRGR